MSKLVIVVDYNDGMNMPLDQMKKNIIHVLEKHFNDMPNYTKISIPRMEINDDEDES